MTGFLQSHEKVVPVPLSLVLIWLLPTVLLLQEAEWNAADANGIFSLWFRCSPENGKIFPLCPAAAPLTSSSKIFGA